MRRYFVGLCAAVFFLENFASAAPQNPPEIRVTTPPAGTQQKGKGPKGPKAKPTTRAGAQSTAAARLEGFDDFAAQAMKDWKVPGAAVAIVQNGQILLSKGYGYREVKNQVPVTSRTLFAIGSITKSFTVATLARLVDQGKLDWDKPVREYMPSFRMYDEATTERMTPRDLVTHRSGLPRHDALWYLSDLSQEEMVARLRYLQPSKDFRSTYQYNNLMFMTAGYLASHLSGLSWEDLVRQTVFAPLGMQNSNFSVLESQKSSDFAHPYGTIKQDKGTEVKEIPFYVQGAIEPAGAINSCADDLAQYVLMYLNKGKHGDAQVISEANIAQMTSPQMVAPGALRWTELGHSSYGMGLGIGSYRGHKTVSHGGAIDGFTALLTFLPQDNIGVVVLTNLNADRNSLPAILTYNVLDRLLGLEEVPWNQRFLEDRRKSDASEAEAKQKGYTTQKKGTRPSRELSEYAGDYTNPGYGKVTIGMDKGELTLRYFQRSAPLKHFHYDVFETPADPLNPLGDTKVNFFTNEAGDIGSLAIRMESNVKEIVFERQGDARLREKSFLEKLVGQYEVGATTVSITLRGENTLILTLPGQPSRELIPRRGTTFDVQGLSGFSIEFKLDASGGVSEAVFYQPNGTFAAKRKP